MADKKPQHGGKRAGAGRKTTNTEGPTRNVGVTVPVALLEKLDGYAATKNWNRSQAVTEAIRTLLKRK